MNNRSSYFVWLSGLVLLLVLLTSSSALAHKASDAYLSVNATTGEKNEPSIGLELAIALRDIDLGVDDLDANGDRQITWGEVKAAWPYVRDWVWAGTSFYCNESALKINWALDGLETHTDGTYARLVGAATCASEFDLSIHYDLLAGLDSTHRLIITGALSGKPLALVIGVTETERKQTILRARAQSLVATGWLENGIRTFAQFFPIGAHHIATGFDHLAFLLALLLPVTIKNGLPRLIKTVTGFTLGHSMTLLLATFNVIGNYQWVEPAIAITIIISAGINLLPKAAVARPWLRPELLAIGFGLIHGLGFSSVMTEARVDTSLLIWALGGFNVGVEFGQLVAVALWIGLGLMLEKWSKFEAIVVRGGSIALMILAIFWTGQRVLI
jgi:HupE / UreJ protein